MKKSEYISIAQVAKMLGISRIAVYKKVKKGDIKAIKIGRSYAIPQSALDKRSINVKGRPLREAEKRTIEKAVRKTVQDYGEVLKKLGRE
ncbi:MAG: helix-turn-helix domain-containing protein [Candidatus Omnitrophica bacterium]|nr:helix-turn-helix domain-containing protein [Candidatus Omnitrophota bacterium]MBU4488752.1 helix-turn-helix domain-containing protein [Candidatus Omnitrophota bacterium]MCG2705849.1 helix-turn-helix domain-containing protein [Candidatus Omnitrophota bacterium]